MFSSRWCLVVDLMCLSTAKLCLCSCCPFFASAVLQDCYCPKGSWVPCGAQCGAWQFKSNLYNDDSIVQLLLPPPTALLQDCHGPEVSWVCC